MLVGVGLQFYVNGGSASFRTDDFPVFPGYRFNISGKPFWSLPANIPVVFEIIVLSSAFASFFGMWILNTLPRLSNPLHRISRFKRATNDRFFLVIDEKDPQFERAAVEEKFNQWGATAIEEVRQDLTDTQLPNFVKLAGILGIVLLLIPPVLIYRAMGMTNRQPRLHFMPDMDWQDKYKAQVVSPNLANDKDDDRLPVCRSARCSRSNSGHDCQGRTRNRQRVLSRHQSGFFAGDRPVEIGGCPDGTGAATGRRGGPRRATGTGLGNHVSPRSEHQCSNTGPRQTTI